MPYVPHTPEDIKAMLEVIGTKSVDDLFAHLPAEVRLEGPLNLPDGVTEEEVRRYFLSVARKNHGQDELISFLGGGVYDAIVPAAIDPLVSRSEFLTAYTPYQPEVSQGTLQAIYEWQSYICRLTGLEVSNASMYDGATALAEAINVSLAAKRKKAVVLPETLNPRYRRVVCTSMKGEGITIIDAPVGADGTIDPQGLAAVITDEVGCVVIQNPNYLGLVEQVDAVGQVVKDSGAVLVAAVNPVSLSVLKTPAEYGAELAVGEAQPFGIKPSWGGPLLGFLACTDAHKRRIPGRVVGPHPGQPRAERLRADPADPRTAYPPGKGHQQHLLQPGPECPAGHRVPGHAGHRGPGRTGTEQSDPGHGSEGNGPRHQGRHAALRRPGVQRDGGPPGQIGPGLLHLRPPARDARGDSARRIRRLRRG